MSATDRESRGEKRCREILEVGEDASLEDIRRAHAFLRSLYGPGASAMVLPSMDEFTPAVQARIMAEIDAAYRELETLLGEAPPAPAPGPRVQEPAGILDGPALRRLREAGGFSLERMASDTSVRQACIEALEEERFGDLPSAAVIVRGYLTAYFAALGMTAEASVTDYVRRYQKWQGKV